jgi:hypothetical protein
MAFARPIRDGAAGAAVVGIAPVAWPVSAAPKNQWLDPNFCLFQREGPAISAKTGLDAPSQAVMHRIL